MICSFEIVDIFKFKIEIETVCCSLGLPTTGPSLFGNFVLTTN